MHSEVEAVRERCLKELGMLNPFLGHAKVKDVYIVWYPRIFNVVDNFFFFLRLSAHCSAVY